MQDDDKRGSRRKSKSAGAGQSSTKNTSENVRRESGEPGGGQGRRDEVGPTGCIPCPEAFRRASTSRFERRRVGDKVIEARPVTRILVDQNWFGATDSCLED